MPTISLSSPIAFPPSLSRAFAVPVPRAPGFSQELSIGGRTFAAQGWELAFYNEMLFGGLRFAIPEKFATFADVAREAWGAPTLSNKNGKRHAWLDAAKTVRWLAYDNGSDTILEIHHVDSVEAFLGRVNAMLTGAASSPRLGMTEVEVRALGVPIHEATAAALYLVFPPSEFGDSPTTVGVAFKDGRVVSLEQIAAAGTIDGEKPITNAVRGFAEQHGITLVPPKKKFGSVQRDGVNLEIATTATATSGNLRAKISAI
jgi:hypothetical protein